jgi:hypothetical protein
VSEIFYYLNLNMSTLATRARQIARLEFNSRHNEGQGRLMEAANMANYLRSEFGNANANNALRRARLNIAAEKKRKDQRVNNLVKNAAKRFMNAHGRARARAAKSLIAPVVRELENLKWVPTKSFRVKRGRSPSPLRSPRNMLNAVHYKRRLTGS